jgi:Cof subfamily protein (haloacid dehalogenase superfamily)
MLYHKKINQESVTHMVDYFEEHHFDYYLESNGGLFASKNLKPRLEHIFFGDVDKDPIAKQKQKEGTHFLNSLIENENMYRNDINKACFLENKSIPFEDIKKEFSDIFTVIHCTVPSFGDNSGELTVPNIHKANAIEILIQHLGIERINTYAFGDGLNDIEMLQYCQVGIAMGNAKQELKDIADEITDADNADGIYNSMKKHNLI